MPARPSRKTVPVVALAAILAAALAGCGKARELEAAASGSVNCTLCHGEPLATFDASVDLTFAAPPRGVNGGTRTADLDVGQHQAHLRAGPFALGFACATCHEVPADLAHANGPLVVTLRGAGQALLPASLGSYDPATHTCATYCHGATIAGGTAATKPPAWTQSFAACDGCHGLPPHSGSSDLTTCATCHPGTMNADGTLDVAGGKHVNGRIDAVGGHLPGYADPANAAFHGPDALAFLERQPGAITCTDCHGADLRGSTGPSCFGCHATPGLPNAVFAQGVANWQTNCTFCHGTPTEPFDYATQLARAAPPADVGGRLSGANTPARTGAHQVHLAGSAIAPAFACATCHAVPTQAAPLAHLSGGAAQVTLSGAGQGSLAASLGTYAGGTCSTYCHRPTSLASGTVGGGTPSWTGSGYACNACHGNTTGDARSFWPSTGEHATHVSANGKNLPCYYCHSEVVTSDTPPAAPGIANVALHVNGTENVRLGDGAVRYNGNVISGTWNASTRSCQPSCHGPQPW